MFPEVDSTNDLALRGAEANAQHGETWVADLQVAGRGRRETGGERREWFSPAESNVYMSTVVRPKIEAAEASKITIATGLSVAATLREQTGVDIWLKWPNDLLVGDLKLAGILTEGVFSGSDFAAAVVGLGLNVNVDAARVPPELESIMTSLQIESGNIFDRMTLVFALRDAIVSAADRLVEGGLESFADIAAVVDRAGGRDVMLSNGERATAVGIDLTSGGLRVDGPAGASVVTTGEAKLMRVNHP
jgi:BirA family biotin operon repressor/biotin-[acetyl-CoA-carboxylase] ligase